jgi:hypothetical protein
MIVRPDGLRPPHKVNHGFTRDGDFIMLMNVVARSGESRSSRMKKVFALGVLAACFVLCGYANEPEGFMDDPWGYRIGAWLKDNPGARKVSEEGGFQWYAPDRSVSLGGTPVEAKYGFWGEKLTVVRIAYKDAAAARVKAHLFSRYGEVQDNGNLVYSWFGYTTEIHLNGLENELRFMSHDLGQKAENRIRREAAPEPAQDRKNRKKGKKK